LTLVVRKTDEERFTVGQQHLGRTNCLLINRGGVMTRIKWLVGIVALIGPSVLTLALAQPVGAATAPSGLIAHSAYGLQLSVPKSWSVQVFGECPDGQKPGTLFIGTPQFGTNCPEFGSKSSQVRIFSSDAIPASLPADQRSIRVHGLSVLSSKSEAGILWIIPSRKVTVMGSGPKALAVMQSLSAATRHATPATGKVSGTEYLEAAMQVPVSGSVTVTMPASGKTFKVAAIAGVFWFFGAPGKYLLAGQDGNVVCPPVAITLVSGESVNAPPIFCQGA
jgi:hypothetical protein